MSHYMYMHFDMYLAADLKAAHERTTMNDFHDSDDNDTDPAQTADPGRRPLGFWLRLVDRLIAHEFATAFGDEDATRRDWRLLSLVDAAETADAAERLGRHRKRLRGLVERGWAVETDGVWSLTDEGRAAKERLGTLVDGIRAKVAGAVSPEDYATTLASLQAIARELGWDESQPMPRSPRRGFGRGFRPGFGFGPGSGFGPGFHPGAGFGPRFGRGFAARAGFGPHAGPEHHTGLGPDAGSEHGFGPGFGPGRRHGHEHGFGPAHAGHHGIPDDAAEHDCPRGGHGRRGRHGAQRAFERGFAAGYDRGAASRDA